jgi:hypothetical protein
MCERARSCVRSACTVHPGQDTVEKEYSEKNTADVNACCAACTADPKCNYAVFKTPTCYLKDGRTMTPTNGTGSTRMPNPCWPSTHLPSEAVRFGRASTRSCKPPVCQALSAQANIWLTLGRCLSESVSDWPRIHYTHAHQKRHLTHPPRH